MRIIFITLLAMLGLTVPQAAQAVDCVRQPHTVVVAQQDEGNGASQSALAGNTVYLHLDMTNNDAQPCGSSNFNIDASALPAGFTASPSLDTTSIDYEEIIGYTLAFTSSASQSPGTYLLPVRVFRAEESTVRTVTLSYTVVAPLTPYVPPPTPAPTPTPAPVPEPTAEPTPTPVPAPAPVPPKKGGGGKKR